MSNADKIKSIEDLAVVTASLRKQGKKIVHCHGVFDLLHLGHFRYFDEAKAMGDVLIVTITTDKLVNKGPHRPAFTELLRAEALAGLANVDYVAISRWPTAVESINLLKPDFYVKGPDYKDASKDMTGKIVDEENAVKAGGGKIAFTSGITFSSTTLINRHIPVLPSEVQSYLADFSTRYPADEVIGYLKKAADLKVLLVGETIIDEYVYTQAIGKSSKEPTLVVKHISDEKFAGGILAAANHVASFCNNVTVLTQLGTKNSQEAFIESKLNKNIKRVFLHRNNAPTIVKRRFVEEYFFTKMLEVYEINDSLLTPEEDDAVCKALEEHVAQYDLVLVIDFGHSMLSDRAGKILRKNAKYLAVNAQSNAGNLGHHTISRYVHADYVACTEGETRIEARDKHGDIKKIATEIYEKMKCDRLVITRGKNGCLCRDKKSAAIEIPAVAGKVVDRIGAGDAFLSISSLLAVQGAPLEVLGLAGNAAGALAVATVGNREPINKIALFRHIESLLK